jgi:hypothetical protein
MSKKKGQDGKSQEKTLELRKSEKKNDFVIIKAETSFPVQEIICRHEHKKIFEMFYKK